MTTRAATKDAMREARGEAMAALAAWQRGTLPPAAALQRSVAGRAGRRGSLESRRAAAGSGTAGGSGGGVPQGHRAGRRICAGTVQPRQPAGRQRTPGGGGGRVSRGRRRAAGLRRRVERARHPAAAPRAPGGSSGRISCRRAAFARMGRSAHQSRRRAARAGTLRARRPGIPCGAEGRPQARRRAWQSRRAVPARRRSGRRGSCVARGDGAGAAGTSLDRQPCRRAADAGTRRGSRTPVPHRPGAAARLCLRPRQPAVRAELSRRPVRRTRSSPNTSAGTNAMRGRWRRPIRHTRWTARRGGGCASATSRPISASTPSPCSPNRCSPRTTATRSSCSATPKSRSRTPPPQRFRALADHWRSTVGLSDEEMAALIRDDRHRRAGRYGRPLRQQPAAGVRAQAGAGADRLFARSRLHSGLSAMDAFLADDALAPAGRRCAVQPSAWSGCRAFRSPIARPRTCRRWRRCPPADNGCITFGHFGRPERLNAGVVAAWSRILHAVPGVAAGAEQPLVPGAGIPQVVPRALRRARHSARPAGPDLHVAAAMHLGGLWRDRHRAGSVPAQRRHDDDRGAVARRAGRHPGRPADGRTVRRVDPARGRAGRLGHRRRRTPMSHARWPRPRT